MLENCVTCTYNVFNFTGLLHVVSFPVSNCYTCWLKDKLNQSENVSKRKDYSSQKLISLSTKGFHEQCNTF